MGDPVTEANRWSVRDILASPSLSGARVLAGLSGLERPVERLNVMEVPDILPWTAPRESQRSASSRGPWTAPRELLLTTGYPLRDRVGTLAELIAALDDAGLSGLGIKRGRYLGALPDDVIGCAEERGFPLVELPEDLRFDDVLHEVLTGKLEEQYRQLARSEQLHRTFLDLVVAGRGLHDISAGLSQLVGLPTAIVDLAGNVLAASDLERLGLTRGVHLTLPPGGRGPVGAAGRAGCACAPECRPAGNSLN